jgi:hypothetical protein
MVDERRRGVENARSTRVDVNNARNNVEMSKVPSALGKPRGRKGAKKGAFSTTNK